MKVNRTAEEWRQRAVWIKRAIAPLRLSRDYLRDAGAKQARKYVAKALKSVEGAYRHASGRAICETMNEEREKGDA